jgi:hypothetical protein
LQKVVQELKGHTTKVAESIRSDLAGLAAEFKHELATLRDYIIRWGPPPVGLHEDDVEEIDMQRDTD